jgi:signal transduction histidine kinase
MIPFYTNRCHTRIPSSEGFGLLGMSERAERIGAQLTIRSQAGQGTEIIVTVDRE